MLRARAKYVQHLFVAAREHDGVGCIGGIAGA
jgi:hypothetical protein